MSSVSSSTSNMMRITGMATGMDTDAMVKAMTASYQIKIDKANQDKQIVQWKQEMYRDIIKDIKGLQDYFDVTSSKYILGSSKFNPIKVTNGDEGAVGFTATSSAQEGNYKINISQLAEPAIVKSLAVQKSDATLSTKLKDIYSDLSGAKFTFNVNDAVAEINVTDTTTINDVLKAINEDPDVVSKKVTASFDELTKKIIFKTNDTGLTNTSGSNNDLKVKVTDDNAADLASKLGFQESTTYQDAGQNAVFNLTYPDGRTESVGNQKTNQFTANGVTYNLKAAGTGDITINVTKNNADAVVTNLKNFITDYNNVIDKIQGKLTEKKQYSYKPLTDEQKESMKDADIEKWEEKAKQGILRNDDYLESLLGNLRGTFSDLVYSDKTSTEVTSIKNPFHMGTYGSDALGLDTSKELDESGKLFIKDETKLKNAISKDIESFTKFFIGKSSDTTLGENNRYIGSNTYYEDGLFTRMDKIIRYYAGDPGMGKDGTYTSKGVLNIFANKQYDYSISGTSGKNTMPDQIYKKVLSIGDMEKKMKEAEDRYYAKFAKLESAMNTMNSQMSNFKAQMGTS